MLKASRFAVDENFPLEQPMQEKFILVRAKSKREKEGATPTIRKVEAQFSMLILVASSFKLNNEYDE